MAGAHVRLEQQEVVVRLVGPQPRHPLRRLPVLDLRVVQAGGHEQVGIVARLHVVVGRVGEHVVVVLAHPRITPLVPLEGRERDARVEHRGHDVDEGHPGHDAVPEVGPHREHRTHQQTAGAAAHRVDPVRVGVSLGREVLGGGDEVGERVLLVEELAVLVPGAAHLLAAADVGDRIDEAPVDQAQERRAERRIHAGAVGTVAIEQQRAAALLGTQVGPVDEGHRHPGAVPGGRPQPFAPVVGGIEASEHLVLLAQGLLARRRVVVEHGPRRGQ